MTTTQYDLFNQPVMPDFNGSEYNALFDKGRLTGQLHKLFELMKDQTFRTLSEIENETAIPQASISAQLRNLRKDRFGGHTVNRRPRGDRFHGLSPVCHYAGGKGVWS